MSVKQFFIPAGLASQIIALDAAEGQRVKASATGDYIAIAGVQASGVSRVFTEADPDNPNQPLIDLITEEILSPDLDANHYLQPGTTYSVSDAIFTVICDRQSILWQIYDPAAPNAILSSSQNNSWTAADTDSLGGGDREFKITITYKDRYSDRTFSRGITGKVFTTLSNAPRFTSAPVISGSTAPGSTITITPPTVTGTPTPTLTYQVQKGGADVGSPQSGVSFVAESAASDYRVIAIASNSVQSGVRSQPSNVISTTSPTVTAPSWTESWGALSELQTTPSGRLYIEIGAATFDSNFEYFIFTSELETNSNADVRRHGAKVTGANTNYTRTPGKATGLLVYPRLIAIAKDVTEEVANTLFVISRFGYPNGYTITGIVATESDSSRARDMPTVPDAITSLAITLPLQSHFVNNTMNGVQYPYFAHAFPFLAFAAYNGHAGAQTRLLAQLENMRGVRSAHPSGASGKTVPFFSTWLGKDPICQGSYPVVFELASIVLYLSALNTPAIYNAMPAAQRLAAGAYIEACFVTQIYGLSAWPSDDTAGRIGGNRISMLGKKNAWTGGAEPNISASAHYILALCTKFLDSSIRGKEYLAARGFTSLNDLMANWTKTGFATFLDSSDLKISGDRVADNLYRTFNASGTPDPGNDSGSGYDDPVPTAADLITSYRLRAGRAWKLAGKQHTLDDIQGIVQRFMNRSFGMSSDLKVAGVGAERDGTIGDLLDLSNPNKITNPPTGNGGARVARKGVRWSTGFAMYATVAPIIANVSGQIGGSTYSGSGTNPDFKKGCPMCKATISSSSTTAQKKAAWDCTESVFNNRRGYVLTDTYADVDGECPFEGQTGPISEMFTTDTGSFYNSSNAGTAGMRSSGFYAEETLRANCLFFMGKAILEQGPKNLLSADQANMTGGWTPGDASWTSGNAPNTSWRSSKIYTLGYTVGQTGTSAELVKNASAVTAGREYLTHVQIQAASGSASVKVEAKFLNSSGVAVGSTVTIYNGTVGTTIKDVEKNFVAPTGAVSYTLVVTVNKGSTTGAVRVGGPGQRYQRVAVFDLSTSDMQNTGPRMRRGIIFHRYMIASGWRCLAKMSLLIDKTNYSNAGDLQWSDVRDYTNNAITLLDYTLNYAISALIPYLRANISGFPDYGDGYKSWDWEGPVTTAAGTGVQSKTP